jgi:hypothetical protein
MRILPKLVAAACIVSLGVTIAAYDSVGAACSTAAECAKAGVETVDGTGGSTDIKGIIKTIVNVLLFILGSVSVVMIVIGGMRYTISQGDSGAITSAKNTILYAVIGLIVAVSAYAIVNLVVEQFVP